MLNQFYRPHSQKSELRRKKIHYKVIFRQVNQKNVNFVTTHDLYRSRQKFKSGHVQSNHKNLQMQTQQIPERKTMGCKSNSESTCPNSRFSSYRLDSESLYLKLKQIERINNSKKLSKYKKKGIQLIKQQTQKKWERYLKKMTSVSTYESVKKLKEAKQQKQKKQKAKQLFGNGNKQQNINVKQVQKISQQKTNELSSFLLGFPYGSTKQQTQQFSQVNNIQKIRKNVQKSSKINLIYQSLVKNKCLQHVKEQQLKDNFLSAVYVNQYIKKNGSYHQKVKGLLKKSNCIL